MDWLLGFYYATAIITPLLSMYRATYLVWRTREPGQRPDATIAALLCCAAGFTYGCTQGQPEPLWINLPGCLAQAFNLVAFLMFCTQEQSRDARKRLMCAAAYLSVIVVSGLGHSHPEICAILCTAAGCVAPCVPLIVLALADTKTVDMVPHWLVSSASALHYAAWSYRGSEQRDNSMMSQNGIGLACSVLLLALAFVLPQPQLAQMENDEVEPAELIMNVASSSSSGSTSSESANTDWTDDNSVGESISISGDLLYHLMVIAFENLNLNAGEAPVEA